MKFEGLLLNELVDRKQQENFQRLQNYLSAEPISNGQWSFLELKFVANATNFRQRVSLSFAPKDVIVTSLRGPGAVQFNYSLFTKDFLDLTITGTSAVPTVIRFLFGTLEG